MTPGQLLLEIETLDREMAALNDRRTALVKQAKEHRIDMVAFNAALQRRRRGEQRAAEIEELAALYAAEAENAERKLATAA